MSENNNVLYIPGLGKNRSIRIQRPGTRIMDFFERRDFYFFNPEWEVGIHSSESFVDKFNRLSAFYRQSGKPSIVYANSAGATLATVLTVEHPDIEQCHLVCGKILGAAKIGPEYSGRAPAFVESVKASESAVKNLDPTIAEKFTCYIPKDREDDGVLEVVDMVIPGANIIELPPLSHARAILYAYWNYLPHL